MIQLKLATREQDTFEQAFKTQIAAYQKLRPDVEIQVVTRPIHDHWQRLVHQNGAQEEGIDLLLCCTDWLPEAIHKGLLHPLNELLVEKAPQDWPQGWHTAMLQLQETDDGQVFGLPWHDGPEVLHYRRDLFEDPANEKAFQEQHGYALTPPHTWDHFLDIARFFTRPDQNLWGCCEAAYSDGHNNVYDFLIQLWSRGGTLFDHHWRPQFHDHHGVEALQFYVDLFHKHRVASLECLDLGSVECGNYYAQGHAAMMWNWCGFAAVSEMPEYSQIVGHNACTTLPHGISLNIYWVLGIIASSPNKAEAYELMHFIAGPEMDKITSLSGANGVRLSTWHDHEIQAKYPYYKIIEDVHGGTRTLPAIPEFPAINEALSQAVHKAVQLQLPVAGVLQEAAERATAILRKSGRL